MNPDDFYAQLKETVDFIQREIALQQYQKDELMTKLDSEIAYFTESLLENHKIFYSRLALLFDVLENKFANKSQYSILVELEKKQFISDKLPNINLDDISLHKFTQMFDNGKFPRERITNSLIFSTAPSAFNFFIRERDVESYFTFLRNLEDKELMKQFIKPLFFTPQTIYFIYNAFYEKMNPYLTGREMSEITLFEEIRKGLKENIHKCPKYILDLFRNKQIGIDPNELIKNYFLDFIFSYPQIFGLLSPLDPISLSDQHENNIKSIKNNEKYIHVFSQIFEGFDSVQFESLLIDDLNNDYSFPDNIKYVDTNDINNILLKKEINSYNLFILKDKGDYQDYHENQNTLDSDEVALISIRNLFKIAPPLPSRLPGNLKSLNPMDIIKKLIVNRGNSSQLYWRKGLFEEAELWIKTSRKTKEYNYMNNWKNKFKRMKDDHKSDIEGLTRTQNHYKLLSFIEKNSRFAFDIIHEYLPTRALQNLLANEKKNIAIKGDIYDSSILHNYKQDLQNVIKEIESKYFENYHFENIPLYIAINKLLFSKFIEKNKDLSVMDKSFHTIIRNEIEQIEERILENQENYENEENSNLENGESENEEEIYNSPLFLISPEDAVFEKIINTLSIAFTSNTNPLTKAKEIVKTFEQIRKFIEFSTGCAVKSTDGNFIKSVFMVINPPMIISNYIYLSEYLFNSPIRSSTNSSSNTSVEVNNLEDCVKEAQRIFEIELLHLLRRSSHKNKTLDMFVEYTNVRKYSIKLDIYGGENKLKVLAKLAGFLDKKHVDDAFDSCKEYLASLNQISLRIADGKTFNYAMCEVTNKKTLVKSSLDGPAVIIFDSNEDFSNLKKIPYANKVLILVSKDCNSLDYNYIQKKVKNINKEVKCIEYTNDDIKSIMSGFLVRCI
ncbi:hypothetical protein TRFO_32775 [Tritrichomonas foetus]|uniref:Uncharacterized protein n=1 Tax=Tritrichomonas foetus TaxID=1144522 RepID=A0A1J4JSK3_9EUKA|nr:hypothetical protein TRFO_32775 [Tritrichomonas foetus]|eukprot:OHT00502.1 hypothetical protein TRFO_32775 [Tritrichomonas foetus]